MDTFELIKAVSEDGLKNDTALLHLGEELAKTVGTLREYVLLLQDTVTKQQLIIEQLQTNIDELRLTKQDRPTN